MKARTDGVPAAPPRPPGRVSLAAKRRQEHMARTITPYAGALAAAAAGDLALHQPGLLWFAAGGTLVHAAIRLHETYGWHRGGGKAAMRRRRKYQGTATRQEMRRNFSPAAARRRAAVVSPGLHPSQAPVVVARKGRRVLAGTREDSYLAIAGPRLGKTGLMACWAADAPGTVLATSTRTDLYAHTAIPRGSLGELHVLNPGEDGGIPSSLVWSPLDGCTSPAIAIERAGYLMAAAPKDSGGKDAWWDAKAAELLRLMLHAAALSGASMHEVAAWVRDPLSREPAAVLAGEFAAPGWDRALAQMADDSDQMRGIAASATAALSWMDDPAMARAACPAGDGFDAAAFLRDGTGTVYLIGADKPHGSLAPYFAAFAANLFETAKWLASSSPGGRLEYPLTFALDEAAITCPVPLHKWTSEAGGHGITVMAAVQKLSQLKSRWGDHDGATIFGNSTVKVFWGGSTDHEDLEALSAVCGMRDTWDHVRNSDGSSTKQPRQERAVPPERIRMLRENEVLVLHRSTRPVIARVTPAWERPGYEAARLGSGAFRPRAAQPAITSGRREAIPMPAGPAAAIGQPSPVPELAGPAEAAAVPDYVPEEAIPSWQPATRG
jgi:type IV secretion system protein VirD4